eukprot:347610-Chlamydomonas_euryale.AAC.1
MGLGAVFAVTRLLTPPPLSTPTAGLPEAYMSEYRVCMGLGAIFAATRLLTPPSTLHTHRRPA